MKDWLKKEDKNSFTNASARKALRVNASNQKRYMIGLQEWNLVRQLKGDKKNGFGYEVATFKDQSQRSQRIEKLMDNIMKEIKQFKKPKRSSTT